MNTLFGYTPTNTYSSQLPACCCREFNDFTILRYGGKAGYQGNKNGWASPETGARGTKLEPLDGMSEASN